MYRNPNAKQKPNKVSLGGEHTATELRESVTSTLKAQVVPMLLTTLLMSEEGERTGRVLKGSPSQQHNTYQNENYTINEILQLLQYTYNLPVPTSIPPKSNIPTYKGQFQ